MEETVEEPFIISVYGAVYTVKDDLVEVKVACRAKPKLFKRRRPADKPPESAIDMQKRIEENIVDMCQQVPYNILCDALAALTACSVAWTGRGS